MFSSSKVNLSWLVLLPLVFFFILNGSLSGRYWQLNSGKLIPLKKSLISSSIELIPPAFSGDLDGDSLSECLVFEGQTLQITNCNGHVLWQSPHDWHVSEALIADMNHDGIKEAVLLVWRAFRPWPTDQFMLHGGRIQNHQNIEGQSCQLILIGWQKGAYREIWAGSALANPISNIRAADLDGDGLIELVALENDYDSNNKRGQITVWRWVGFVFSLLNRSESRWERFAIIWDGAQYCLFTQ